MMFLCDHLVPACLGIYALKTRFATSNHHEIVVVG
jgi:hypothetical protein